MLRVSYLNMIFVVDVCLIEYIFSVSPFYLLEQDDEEDDGNDQEDSSKCPAQPISPHHYHLILFDLGIY